MPTAASMTAQKRWGINLSTPGPSLGRTRHGSGRLCPVAARPADSPARQDVHDVAVLHLVRLALQPINAVALRFLHRPDAVEVLVTDHLGAHEAARQVRVNLPRALDRVSPFRDRPGAALVLADGEEHDLVHAG